MIDFTLLCFRYIFFGFMVLLFILVMSYAIGILIPLMIIEVYKDLSEFWAVY